MRTAALTKNRNRRQSAASVSLFPFLAVLICTMGSLILLLVVITRQARLQAAQIAAARAAEKQKESKETREEVQWKIELLKQSRAKTQSQLDESRLALGHIEDHARRLGDRMDQLEAALAELERTGSDDGRHRARLEAEIEAVQAEIANARRQLDDARKAAQHRRRSYAIVPYSGPHETRRRPIYIECTADAAVLQPEGIALGEEDFDGPMGPGNPLAAALRAEREYLLAKGNLDPDEVGEPYPLLLVRPGGIGAYYAARAAMKSWGPEFGYELVGADWQLKFQPPDPELARVVRRAIDTARKRQKRLAVAAPSHYYGTGTRTRYRASRTGGGIVPDGRLLDEGAGGGASGGPNGRFGSSRSSHSRRRLGRTLPYGDSANGGSANGGSGRGSYTGSGDGLGGTGRDGVGQGDAGTAGTGLDAAALGGTGIEGTNAAGALGAGSGRAGRAGGARGGSSAGGSSIGGSSLAAAGPASNGPGNMGSGHAGLAEADRRNPTSPSGLAGGAPGRTAATSAGQGEPGTTSDGQWRPGEWRPKSASAGGGSASASLRPHVKSLANSRGANWGLPNTAAASVPISRPIRIDCYRNRLVIVPEPGLIGGKSISLGPRTELSIDAFVSAVWQYMEGWGIAGNGMYWRPILKVRVAPEAEPRFAELNILLEDSGLKIERKD